MTSLSSSSKLLTPNMITTSNNMSDAKKLVKFSFKVTINKEKTKVLFAEADSDFVDVLLSFLTLPLGKLVKVLEKHYGVEAPVIGSLNTLYKGLANLDSVCFWREDIKQTLLDPENTFRSECRELKLDINETQPFEYFACEICCRNYRIINPCFGETARCQHCGMKMMRKIVVDECDAGGDGGFLKNGRKRRFDECFYEDFSENWPRKRLFDESHAAGDGCFVKSGASFLISDDLKIFSSTGGFLQTLRNFGISHMDVAETRNVTFGYSEIMDLLKGSIFSRTPLSDIILKRGQMGSATTKCEMGKLHQVEKTATYNSKKMVLKVTVQKSTKNLLFVQAEEDFINFLFSLLTIPLGGVEYLLGSNTCFNSINNLYKSVENITDIKCLSSANIKTKLLTPQLPYGYISRSQILPLSEEYCDPSYNKVWVSNVKFQKGHGNYVKGPRMYKVAHDLTVTPFCTVSCLSALRKLKIPLSDVEETELHIGLEEAFCILKASLLSTSALTDGLINPMLKKQPKHGALKDCLINPMLKKQPKQEC